MFWWWPWPKMGPGHLGLSTSPFHIMMTMVHKEQKEQHIWRLFINGSSGFYGLITSQQSNRGQVGVGGQNDSGSPNKETQRPNGDKLDKLLLDKRFLDKIICRFKLEYWSKSDKMLWSHHRQWKQKCPSPVVRQKSVFSGSDLVIPIRNSKYAWISQRFQ